MTLEKHLKNREWMVASLASEIFGPGGRFQDWKNDLYTNAIEFEPPPGHIFEKWDDYNARYVHPGDQEEILKDESPLRRYGVGILFPDDGKEAGQETPDETSVANEASAGLIIRIKEDAQEVLADGPKYEQKLRAEKVKTAERLLSLKTNEEDLAPDDETDPGRIGLARIAKPRSMGVSFAADLAGAGELVINLTGGRYRPITGIRVKRKDGSIPNEERGSTWWIRVPSFSIYSIMFNKLRTPGSYYFPLSLEPSDVSGLYPLDLTLTVISRSVGSEIENLYSSDARLLTVTIVNKTQKQHDAARLGALFQCRFTVIPKREDGTHVILPYPGLSRRKQDKEEESLDLLYRKNKVFATGHGCAGNWEAGENSDRAECVVAEPLPVCETPMVTPELVHPKTKKPLRILMAPLTGDDPSALQPLCELTDLYEAWIEAKCSEMALLEERLRPAAMRHLDACRACVKRIRDGLALLQENKEVWLAFRLANRAVLTQQIAGKLGKRILSYDARSRRLVWDKDYKVPDPATQEGLERAWRPFQIAFLLMSLRGLWDGSSADRQIADLIWFPTGGGKTEAYLGAAAFSLFARRLQDPEDDGTGVLMRYTLRLLTAQQFQRAAGLICAMEVIRQGMPKLLGHAPFRIGIWVGGSTTPNTHEQSLAYLKMAEREGPEAYSHALLRCPWCGATIGPRKRDRNEPGAINYICDGVKISGRGQGRKTILHCPDPDCQFYDELPVRVVDQGIYDEPPSLVIGTVDKFAMLAWKPNARHIFGIDMQGKRQLSPPGLIIQDELHLITGPLGSMVGLYEGLIEELCTDRRYKNPVIPKLIASTATTRASTRQIRDLYARAETAIFPAPGLEVDDSFFAKYDRDEKGQIKPGRMYMGILARAYGSGLTVNVRVFSALLAAAARIDDPQERDPWWTLLVFYNSLRELGADLTLFGADIPERLKDLQRRWHPAEKRRYLREVKELTGRLSNSEVPQALDMLERAVGKHNYPVDACLASNIIEVGVDVGRLGIMAVSGQPKTMAQYIQATGRVGREMPGLVVMVYANRKSRDLSHFEHFKSCHSRLYAQVEPASVTPFTLPVLERALHGVFIAWIRQRLDLITIERPTPAPEKENRLMTELKLCATSLLKRVRLLLQNDPATQAYAEKVLRTVFKHRQEEWLYGRPEVWDNNRDMLGDLGEQPLMRFYGMPCKAQWIEKCWETPTSMRGVDAECPVSIFTPDPSGADSNAADDAGEFEGL